MSLWEDLDVARFVREGGRCMDVTLDRERIACASEACEVLVWDGDEVRFLDPHRIGSEDGRLLAFCDGERFEVVCEAYALDDVLPDTLRTVWVHICADPGEAGAVWFNREFHAIVMDGIVVGPLIGHARSMGDNAMISFDGCVWTITAPGLARLIRR